ncbi:hypothetical protein GRI58_12585 [Porphyrobacter algicida]|uniref:Uncharacterized protein n=1 Tax=Qipengyuania algicida TaxID=1836209 RepID=A0A845AL93_9SPHN|nr:hypothetical protein [Qipengyuania algicida]MXP29651.1 hypothetical protein [Qipengyuania algicida]
MLLRTALIVSAALVTSNVAAAQEQEQARIEFRSVALDQSRFISAASVRKAGGFLKLATRSGASFTITAVKPPKGYPDSCLIDRASLEKQVAKLGFAGKIQPGGSEIKMKAKRSGDQTICQGEGNGCVVIVADWDPDDPVLPK